MRDGAVFLALLALLLSVDVDGFTATEYFLLFHNFFSVGNFTVFCSFAFCSARFFAFSAGFFHKFGLKLNQFSFFLTFHSFFLLRVGAIVEKIILGMKFQQMISPFFSMYI